MRGKRAQLYKYRIVDVQVTPPRQLKMVGGMVNQARRLCPFLAPACPPLFTRLELGMLALANGYILPIVQPPNTTPVSIVGNEYF